MNPIHTLDELEEALSRPTQGGLDTLRALEGDVMVLGTGGKMGPTLVRMARRGLDAIGQGDANARAIQCLAHAASPPLALNVTGIECVSIRRLAQRFGELLEREPVFTGKEGEMVWLWNPTRSYELFGPPSVTLEEMIEVTAQWQRHGGATLGKPTHFETTDGRF